MHSSHTSRSHNHDDPALPMPLGLNENINLLYTPGPPAYSIAASTTRCYHRIHGSTGPALSTYMHAFSLHHLSAHFFSFVFSHSSKYVQEGCRSDVDCNSASYRSPRSTFTIPEHGGLTKAGAIPSCCTVPHFKFV